MVFGLAVAISAVSCAPAIPSSVIWLKAVEADPFCQYHRHDVIWSPSRWLWAISRFVTPLTKYTNIKMPLFCFFGCSYKIVYSSAIARLRPIRVRMGILLGSLRLAIVGRAWPPIPVVAKPWILDVNFPLLGDVVVEKCDEVVDHDLIVDRLASL